MCQNARFTSRSHIYRYALISPDVPANLGLLTCWLVTSTASSSLSSDSCLLDCSTLGLVDFFAFVGILPVPSECSSFFRFLCASDVDDASGVFSSTCIEPGSRKGWCLSLCDNTVLLHATYCRLSPAACSCLEMASQTRLCC